VREAILEIIRLARTITLSEGEAGDDQADGLIEVLEKEPFFWRLYQRWTAALREESVEFIESAERENDEMLDRYLNVQGFLMKHRKPVQNPDRIKEIVRQREEEHLTFGQIGKLHKISADYARKIYDREKGRPHSAGH
jgi:hypothetical protein